MSVKDRILCALGFHGKMEDTKELITTIDRPGEISQARRIVGRIVRCTICGRRKNKFVY